MNEQTYFYAFLEPFSKELAYVARELENSIFTSPRTMLTHARNFTEAIVEKVILTEKISLNKHTTFMQQLGILDEHGILQSEVRDALHAVRLNGNRAAHDVRHFRFSEALFSWEALYIIVKWYIEVYGPINMNVPDYKDPHPKQHESYDMAELQVRLDKLERLLSASIEDMQSEGSAETAAAVDLERVRTGEIEQENHTPGLTTIRKISYQDAYIEIPYFLRDAFLLPQRFAKSERFLVRLGAEEQARIISELPADLEGLHTYVKRYNPSNDQTFFCRIEDLRRRRKKPPPPAYGKAR
ncbi:DUF4145 domain-containing protein [Virgibacillus halophilus]|uniref:DUF4145 domain-containing protein n=1 Tax=Tigheibacillus halophilus TaxID=361280 RepID=A0ABU5C6L9_9BACI|nr:DUF4145 domain-containing protein [Virgibacillus halophilus]